MGRIAKCKPQKKENYACRVMITCSEPNADGEMTVEMDVQGDATLAAFLVDNASQAFEDPCDAQQSK
ncbi:MAG: hypothetical protein KGQ49_03680 [Verrucomicrobia bacterium]|nr:hypothetical protein [Verrucomicrobiota bacterium]MBU6446481.1 hypothetical protein [Verrucomicrobiota bacterium]MDE3047682.1 hypothetical protein [Verrucomicrobiota bacterium]